MAELELVHSSLVGVFWLHDHPKEGDVLVKEGPLTSVVMEGEGKLKEGSLLFGEMKIIEPQNGMGKARYTLAQLPNGKKYPVCMESTVRGELKPGAIDTVQPHNVAMWKDRWRSPW